MDAKIAVKTHARLSQPKSNFSSLPGLEKGRDLVGDKPAPGPSLIVLGDGIGRELGQDVLGQFDRIRILLTFA